MGEQKKTAVVALGGTAIMRPGEEGNIYQQVANIEKALAGVMELIKHGYRLVITHGNGPQVGNLFLMAEASKDVVPEMPLGVCVADTQGQIGYIIQKTLRNHLIQAGYDFEVMTIVTQVVVDKDDPSFNNPTKPIGPFYSKEEGKRIEEERGWHVVEDSGHGYRMVVPSPDPLRIIETDIIQMLLEDDVIVVAVGGGGIPVVVESDKTYEDIDVVIDNDLASSLLAKDIHADLLMILTGVDKVAINFNTPEEKTFDTLLMDEALAYFNQGHFPAVNMGPKIKAAIDFLQSGGEEVIITSSEKVGEALEGRNGTRILRQ